MATKILDSILCNTCGMTRAWMILEKIWIKNKLNLYEWISRRCEERKIGIKSIIIGYESGSNWMRRLKSEFSKRLLIIDFFYLFSFRNQNTTLAQYIMKYSKRKANLFQLKILNFRFMVLYLITGPLIKYLHVVDLAYLLFDFIIFY